MKNDQTTGTWQDDIWCPIISPCFALLMKGKWESTSFWSESSFHFGHYITGCKSDHIVYFHALKATLVIKRGIVLDQWSRGLPVMLEKVFCCALITKLWSIILMEADFNATNKILYGQWMLEVVRKYKLMPEEIYSKNRESSVLWHCAPNKITSRN